jgi:hypothetical protein
MEDDIYCGGNFWQAPTYRCGWIVWIGPGNRFILASDPREPGGMAWSDPDGTGQVIYTLDEMKARLAGWTHLGELHTMLHLLPPSPGPASEPKGDA